MREAVALVGILSLASPRRIHAKFLAEMGSQTSVISESDQRSEKVARACSKSSSLIRKRGTVKYSQVSAAHKKHGGKSFTIAKHTR